MYLQNFMTLDYTLEWEGVPSPSHGVGRGAWMAQWVRCCTLDFSSGLDLTNHETKPRVGLCWALH